MPEVHERLHALGIRLLADDATDPVRAECVRLALELHRDGRKVIGLIPAGDRTGVTSLALQLGLALADLTGAAVAVVDGNAVWPAFPGWDQGQAHGLFVTHWVQGQLALLTPRAAHPGAIIPELHAALVEESSLFAHVIVDLTGFDVLGDHLEALDLVDCAIVVARAGRTRDTELRRCAAAVPADKSLGVVLLGA